MTNTLSAILVSVSFSIIATQAGAVPLPSTGPGSEVDTNTASSLMGIDTVGIDTKSVKESGSPQKVAAFTWGD